jgi:hypothetical protein
MTWGFTAAAAVVVGGSLLQANSSRKAAAQASDAQIRASEAGIAEQQYQFDALQELFKPYVEAGTKAIGGMQPYAEAGAPALAQQQAILGLSGAGEQAKAISALESSPLYRAQVRQGEEALLQSASATGGLRGGNVQAALAQFRPQMLQNQIDLQYGRLGGLTELGQTTTQNLAKLGQSSAAGQGVAGMENARAISGLYGNIGASQAGRAIAEQKAQSQLQSSLLSVVGQGLGGMSGSGGSGGIGSLFSDRRLKRNIRKLGSRPDGLGIYEFDYVWGGGKNIGLMAQEVIHVYPHAVSMVNGYLTVNYDQV